VRQRGILPSRQPEKEFFVEVGDLFPVILFPSPFRSPPAVGLGHLRVILNMAQLEQQVIRIAFEVDPIIAKNFAIGGRMEGKDAVPTAQGLQQGRIGAAPAARTSRTRFSISMKRRRMFGGKSDWAVSAGTVCAVRFNVIQYDCTSGQLVGIRLNYEKVGPP